MVDLKEYLEFDPSKKDAKRASKIVTHLRQVMENIVEIDRYNTNKRYLFGTQDMKEVRNMFRNEGKKAGIKFLAMAIFEKIRNVIVSEEENEDLCVELKAEDATATNQKDTDRALLANRGWIEPMMSQVHSMIGLPPYSLKNDADAKFNGNLDKFDDMGLDSGSAQDIDYFFATHYRLLHEIIGEQPINYFIKYNELSEMIALFVNDILAVKTIALRTYVNDITGAIDYKYLDPSAIKAVRGKRRDFKDATALGYEQSMSVPDFIKMCGNDFDYISDMPELLRAVNTYNKTTYSGVMHEGKLYFGTADQACEYSRFLSYHVGVGYIEWKEIDAASYKVTEKNYHGNFSIRKAPLAGEANPNSIYRRDTRYYETTYKAYYLCYSSWEQKLYKYGKLSYQMIEGAEDEYSNFSIIVTQEFGKSAIEVAMPYIDFIEKNFKKFEWMVMRAKPPGRAYNYESLVKIAAGMFPNLNEEQGADKVMLKFAEGVNEIYTLPEMDGKPLGGGTQVNYDIPHGLSKSIIEFKGIIDWAFGQISEQIGISPFRAVEQLGERTGYGVQNSVNQNSQKATQYIHKMIVRSVKNVAVRTKYFVQDIITFGDKNTLPYKFLLKALGDKTVQELALLKEFASHRYGIFVEGLYSRSDKDEQKAIAMQALQKNQISYEQWMLIDGMASPKKAIMVLSYEKKRNERVVQQQAAQAAQAQQQLAQMQHQNKMEEINLEGQLKLQQENVRGRWYAESFQLQSQTDLQKQQMKLAAEPQKIYTQLDAELKQKEAEAQMGSQAPMPVAT